MIRLIKFLLVLAVILAAIVLAFAYLGDLTPARQEINEPVTLEEVE